MHVPNAFGTCIFFKNELNKSNYLSAELVYYAVLVIVKAWMVLITPTLMVGLIFNHFKIYFLFHTGSKFVNNCFLH